MRLTRRAEIRCLNATICEGSPESQQLSVPRLYRWKDYLKLEASCIALACDLDEICIPQNLES